MEEPPNKLTNPDAQYFLDDLHNVLNGGSPSQPLDVLREQTGTTAYLQQGGASSEGSTVDLDLDAQEESTLIDTDEIQRIKNNLGQLIGRRTPPRPPRVHMFLPTQPVSKPEVISKEPKFKTIEAAVLDLLGSRSLSKEEITTAILSLRRNGDIADDIRITRLSIGSVIAALIRGKILVSDAVGNLKVVKVAGGSTNGPEGSRAEVAKDTRPSLIDRMNDIVDGVTEKATKGTAYGRLIEKLESLIATAPSNIKTKLKTFLHFKVDGKRIEDILKNLPSIEGWVPAGEYPQLVEIAEEAFHDEENYGVEAKVRNALMMYPEGATAKPGETHRYETASEEPALSNDNTSPEHTEHTIPNQEGRNVQEKSPEELISHVENFDELYSTLRIIGSVTDSLGRVRTAEDLISLIGKIREGEIAHFITNVTNTYGLRDKVIQLLNAERAQSNESNQTREEQRISSGQISANEEEIISGELPYPEGQAPFEQEGINTNPVPAPMFPPQQPREVPEPRPLVEAKVNHQVITVEELSRRAEAQRLAKESTPTEKTNQEKMMLVEGVNNFDELFEVLKKFQTIPGSDGTMFTAEIVISKIEDIRRQGDFESLRRIPRAYGLRGKARELLKIEVAQKISSSVPAESQPTDVFEAPLLGAEFNPIELITQVTNFDQFYEAIRTIGQTVGDIKDGGKVFTAEQIIDIIKKRERFAALDIPLTYGIRSKYRDLLRIENEQPSFVEGEGIPPPPLADQHDISTGPITKEQSEQIEHELRERLSFAREKFAAHEAVYKTKVREGKKVFQSIMDKLNASGKQRPPLPKEAEHIEAEKEYMEAKWNLKNFIAGKNVREVPVSQEGSLLGLDATRTKRVDVGVLEQAEREYALLQRRVMESTPEKEKNIVSRAFEKWNQLPVGRRLVLSAALLTAGGVAVGSIGVSGALAALGWRLGRSVVGAGAGLVAGVRYGEAKDRQVKEKQRERLLEYGGSEMEDKEQFIEEEEGLAKFFQEQEKEIKKNQLKKAGIVAAVAGVTAAGLGIGGQAMMGESMSSGAKVSGGSDANTATAKTSWFDRLVKGVPETKTQPVQPIEAVSPEKIDVGFKGYTPAGVELSNDGFIDTISKLKESLKGHTVPEAVEKLLSQSPEKIAMDLGLYKPGQVAESAFGLKGEQLTLNINGDIALMHNDGSVNILFDAKGTVHQFGEYAGNTMFDADNPGASPIPPDSPEITQPVKTPNVIERQNVPPINAIEEEISARTSSDSAVADGAVASVSTPSFEGRSLTSINFNEIAVKGSEYKDPQSIIVGELPLKSDYQFDPKFKLERTAYNLQFEKALMSIPTDTFDLRYPIEYNGGRINVFQKGNNITILLNGQKIGTGQIINGQPGLQYETSLGKGMFGVKNGFEKAFETAREGIEKNKMFFKVTK